ncbi:AAA family ATPase [bacterium]|nr:AAA family ATPase [bacterium]
MLEPREIEGRAKQFRDEYRKLKAEIAKVIVGNEPIVDGVLTVVFAGGHCLLEGVPGLGKTLLVRTLASVLDLEFSRIQFTPDLMPADIVGTTLVVETDTGKREFQFRKGPIFAQIVLADEINRATPKTQSAMLEAMQEQRVTAGGQTWDLPQPFFVLATQNPIEQEGTYPLPEAQLDRFLYKLVVPYSTRAEMREIVDRTTGKETPTPSKVMTGAQIIAWRDLVREVVVAPHVKDYIVRLVLATHPKGQHAVEATNKYLRFGASPRGAQAITLAAKFKALLDGRWNVAFDDVKATALNCLRHRVILNFEGEAEGISADDVCTRILEGTPETVKDQEAAVR